ncbi:MAG TPA: response regulator transcription factor [Mycobacteriales bacterium]|nr:response regulator transcription factor [Mycobacteriales bacterium]
MTAIRVLLADDHPLYRSGLRVLLDTQPDTEVVGEAATGEEALALAAHVVPDVIVMDLSMPGAGGLTAIQAITDRQPGAKVLALTMLDDGASVTAAIRAGARGYLVKGAAGDEALHAIRAVAAGQHVFDARVAHELLSAAQSNSAHIADDVFPELTERERDILRLLAKGQPNATIARQLHLTEKTVRNYATTIFRKLDVTSRVEAAIKARDAGI